jgi:hypothetical protein
MWPSAMLSIASPGPMWPSAMLSIASPGTMWPTAMLSIASPGPMWADCDAIYSESRPDVGGLRCYL